MQNVKRTANYSLDELETIVYHLELRPDLVSGKLGAEYKTIFDQKQAWQEIADAVNAINTDQDRNPLEIKRKWQDFKYRIRAKVEKITKNKDIAEDGTPLYFKLTPLEERVLTLLAIAAPSSLSGLNLDSLLEKTENEKDLDEEEEPDEPSNIEENSTKDRAGHLNSKKKKNQAALSKLNSTQNDPNAIPRTTSTERVRRFRKRKAVMNGVLQSNFNSQNVLIEEVKELKREVKKLRECFQDLVNLKKASLELKCLKYDVQVEDLL